MYDTMLTKKNLNLEELAIQKIPLQKLIKERKDRQCKLEKMLHQKQKIIEAETNQLFQTLYLPARKLKSQTINFDETVQYVDSYEEIEERSLNYIRSHPFKSKIDWFQIIRNGKERRLYLHQNYHSTYMLQSKRRATKKAFRRELFEKSVHGLADLMEDMEEDEIIMEEEHMSYTELEALEKQFQETYDLSD